MSRGQAANDRCGKPVEYPAESQVRRRTKASAC